MPKYDKNRLKVEEYYASSVLNSSLEDQLYWACQTQDLEAAKNIFSKKEDKVNLNQLRENGYTLLHEAVFQNNPELINLLILQEANVNATSSSGLTPLHIASNNGFLEAAKILLHFGADLGLRNAQGQSALFCAVRRRKTKIVDLLLKRAKKFGDHYALCESIIRGGEVPLLTNLPEDSRFEVESPLLWAVELNRIEWVNSLLRAGAKIEQPGHSLLHQAILKNSHQVIRNLLVHGANVERFSEDFPFLGSVTPLYLAASQRQAENLQLLLNHGARPNKPGCKRNGNTALHVCAMHGHVDCLKTLLLHGADPNMCNDNGDTPLNLACFYLESEVVHLLIDYGTNLEIRNHRGVGPLQNACIRGQVAIVKILLDAGANPEVRNKFNQTTLHFAIKYNKPVVLKFLLKRCDLELVNTRDCWGDTPMMIALAVGSCKILEILMKHSAHDTELCHFEKCRDKDCPVIRHFEKLEVLNGIRQNEEFQQEIETMKKIRVSSYPRRVTLYDVMFSDRNHMARFADNEILAEMKDFETQFPVFGFLLNLNCRRGRSRMARVRRAQEFLESVLGQILPDFCTNKIFDHLSNEQLDEIIHF